ncbi:MAG: hypothetical protein WDA65_03585 [Christensenellales bacterium]
MRFKPALKYQIYEAKKQIIIFYIAAILFYTLMAISMGGLINSGARVTISGLEAASIIFLFVFGLNSHKSAFHMMMANGVSRKTFFRSFLASAAAVSIGMAVINSLIGVILKQFIDYRTIFEQLRHGYTAYGAAFFGMELLWQFYCYISAVIVGHFITTLFYRMNKTVKLLVSIGAPVFFLIVLPIIDSNLFDGAVYNAIGRFFSYISGLHSQNAPISICLKSASLALWTGLSYITLRRAPVKA